MTTTEITAAHTATKATATTAETAAGTNTKDSQENFLPFGHLAPRFRIF